MLSTHPSAVVLLSSKFNFGVLRHKHYVTSEQAARDNGAPAHTKAEREGYRRWLFSSDLESLLPVL